ncbi:MAG: hypothetical protein RJA70_3492 [Pseudomonadota bacterium]|jgi:hypothetical protein
MALRGQLNRANSRMLGPPDYRRQRNSPSARCSPLCGTNPGLQSRDPYQWALLNSTEPLIDSDAFKWFVCSLEKHLLVAQMKAGQLDRGPPSSQRR